MSVAAPRLVEPPTKPRPGDTAIVQRLEVAPTEFIGDAIRPEAKPTVKPAAKPSAKPGPQTSSTPAAKVRPKPVPRVAVQADAVAAAPVEVVPVVTPAAVEPAAVEPAVVEPAVVEPAAVPPTPAVEPVPAAVPTAPRIALPPRTSPPKPAPPAARLAMPSAPARGDAVAGSPAATSAPPAPSPAPTPTAAPADDGQLPHDLEETRIVASRLGDRFVLQFSTGENSTVYGTGLVGRNPVTQPGEYVDQIVTILDPGKSVSKTHIEFGQTAGAFWVVDRYSANGTVVRQPDAPPQRLDPGKRQPIARGTRVDMGEQFFVVS